MNFYGELIGTTVEQMKQLNITIVGNEPQLNDDHRESITQPVFEKENWEALQEI